MKTVFSTHFTRLIASLVVLTAVFTLSFYNPARAASSVNRVAAAAHAAPLRAGNSTASIEVTKLEHNITYQGFTGMLIHLYITANNLKDTDLRIGVFFFWDDDDPMTANPGSDSTFITPDGHLTYQEVITPGYDSTEWKDYKMFIPYDYFPTLAGRHGGYVLPELGLDGQDFAVFGKRSNSRATFVITG